MATYTCPTCREFALVILSHYDGEPVRFATCQPNDSGCGQTFEVSTDYEVDGATMIDATTFEALE